MKAIYGNTTESFGADPSDIDKSYEYRFKVVSLDDVITSHLDSMAVNPNYPKELQPRKVTRKRKDISPDALISRINY